MKIIVSCRPSHLTLTNMQIQPFSSNMLRVVLLYSHGRYILHFLLRDLAVEKVMDGRWIHRDAKKSTQSDVRESRGGWAEPSK